MPQLDQKYQKRVEELLEVLNHPWDEHVPVVVLVLDQRPVQLLDSLRPATPLAPPWIGMSLLTVESQALRTAKKGISIRLQQTCWLGFNQRRRVGIMISIPVHYLQAAYDR